SPPRRSSTRTRASSCSSTPRRSRSPPPTTGSSSGRSRRSSRASGGSSSDAHEPRAHLPPRRPHREGAQRHAGCARQGPRRSASGSDPRAHRRIEARGLDRRRGAEDPRVLLPPDARGEPRVGGPLPEDARGSLSEEVPLVMRLVVGITGATGVIYGIRLLEVLRGYPDVETHLVISVPGRRTIGEETAFAAKDVEALAAYHYDNKDTGASIASGSFRTAGMVIAPCSIKTAGASTVVDLSVVIPVYNEEENLPPLWAELRGVLERLGLAVEVIFVDDGSRDGSAEIVRGLRAADPRVHLVRLKSNAGETAATD